MQEIKKVAFLGAGALGAAYISKFIDAGDFEAVVVADGERYGRLGSDGLIVNGRQYRFPVVRPDERSTTADMMRMMWWKFMINVGINQAAAVMRAPFGVFQTSSDAQALMEALMREVIVVARASDINLSGQDIKEWYGFLNTLAGSGKPSMLQDIEAGRQTEVDIFAGKVVALGEALGIPTPINQSALHIIRVLEQHPA